MKTDELKKQHIKTLLKMFLDEDRYCKSIQESEYNIKKYTDVIFDVTSAYGEDIPIDDNPIDDEVNGYRQALTEYTEAIKQIKLNQ